MSDEESPGDDVPEIGDDLDDRDEFLNDPLWKNIEDVEEIEEEEPE
jgi:hypothetical protein